MLRGMTSRHVQEWKAFADLEPFDNDREDYHFGAIVQMLANINRKKGHRPFTLDEAALRFGDRPVPQRMKSLTDIQSLAKSLTEASQRPRRKK